MINMELLSAILIVIAIAGETTAQEKKTNKEIVKSLFYPTAPQQYPIILQLQPTASSIAYNNALDIVPSYIYDKASQDYIGLLQHQFPHQESGRPIFLGGKPKIPGIKPQEINEDYHKLSGNSINISADNKLLLDEFEPRYKRSLPYAWYNPSTVMSNNYIKDERTNSRSITVDTSASDTLSRFVPQPPIIQPFGPYTTWTPYNGEMQNQAKRKNKREIADHKGKQFAPPALYSFGFPQISHPHPVFPKAPVIHGAHHVISPQGPILPPPLKEAILQMAVQSPAHAVAYNIL